MNQYVNNNNDLALIKHIIIDNGTTNRIILKIKLSNTL